jgi:hypothetical protein
MRAAFKRVRNDMRMDKGIRKRTTRNQWLRATLVASGGVIAISFAGIVRSEAEVLRALESTGRYQ